MKQRLEEQAREIDEMLSRTGWNPEEAAQRLVIKENTFRRYRAGTHPASERIMDLVRAAGRPTRKASGALEVEAGISPLRDVEIALRYIPVLTWSQAGRVLVAFDELPKHWQDRIPTDVRDPKAVAIEVRGDSMEPHIRQGDRVVVLPSQEPRNGDIVVAKFKDDGIVIKLYHESDGGRRVNLASFNPLYPPTDYSRDEFEVIVPVDSLVKRIRMH